MRAARSSRRGSPCTTGRSRRWRSPSTRATVSDAARRQPAPFVPLPARARASAARDRHALQRTRAARRRARRLVRRARRRPPDDRPAARLQAPDAADEHGERARRRDGRGDDDRDRGGVSDRAAAGSDAKAKLLGLDKLALADQYAPIGDPRAVLVGRGGRARRHVVQRASRRAWRRSSASCLDAGPRRRAPAPGQGDGRVLHGGVEDDPAVRPDELHEPAARRQHARARVRPRDAQRACARGADVALAPRRAVRWPRCRRRSRSRSPTTTCSRTRTIRGRALRSPPTASRTRSPRSTGRRCSRASSSARTRVRGDGRSLAAERLNELWWEENSKYYGDALELPEGYTSAGRTSRTSSTSASTRTRTRSRSSSRCCSTGATAKKARRSHRSTSTSSRRRVSVAGGSRRAVRARPPLDRHVARGVRRAE